MNIRLRHRSAPPRPRTSVLVAATAALAVAGAAGCSDGGGAGGGGRVGVTASFYPLEYVAQRIGGSHVQVTGLTKPGTEPHDLELTPRQIGGLTDADLVVYLKGLQPAVDRAVEQARPRHVAEAGEFVPLEEHGHGGEDHADHGDHGEGGEGRDHSGGDPHIWLDPTLLAKVAGGVGQRLAEADPDHAGDYRANTRTLVGELKALDKEFSDGLAGVKNRTFITTHAAFGYLAERYGLDQHGISGVDPESEPSPARLAALQRTAHKEKVTTIFFETLADPRTAETLAKDLGLKTSVLDPLEGVKDPGKDDYFSVMRQNLANLRAALGTS